MTKVSTSRSSVTQFNNAIKAAGESVTKPEVQKALKTLGTALSKTELTAVQGLLKKDVLTPAARETVKAFIADKTAGGGATPPLKVSADRASFIKTHVNEWTMRARLALKPEADVLPAGAKFASVKANGYEVLVHVKRNQTPDTAANYYLRTNGRAAGPFELPLQLGNAKDAKALLQKDEGLRNDLFDAAFGPVRSKSSSAIIKDVTARRGGGFDVEVQLVHWRTRAVMKEETVGLSGAGKVEYKPGGFSTEAIGEEDAGGGRPDITTAAIGEEGGGGTVTTQAVGEEGGDGRPDITTAAIGEEGGGWATTQAVGEEDGGGGTGRGGRVTTAAIGEEDGGTGRGGRGGVSTQAVGEEG